MRVLALSVVLWWNFANVLTNLLLKGPAKLQRQSCLASMPSVPVCPDNSGDRADRTGCRNLEGRIAGCLSISLDVVCRGLNWLSQQDQCARKTALKGFIIIQGPSLLYL